MGMEKQLVSIAYWAGIVCTILALLSRGLLMIGVLVFPLMASTPTHILLSPRSFLDGALLFFVMAIASSGVVWAKAQQS
jgi:carbon starvation protein CstA